jgi:hypothetical protein
VTRARQPTTFRRGMKKESLRALALAVLASALLAGAGGCKSHTQPFSSEAGGFSVTFPGDEAPADHAKTAGGIETHSVETHDRLARSYRVTWSDLGANGGDMSPKEFFEIQEEYLKKVTKLDIDQQKDVPLGMLPGHEYTGHTTANGAEEIVTTRVYVKLRRIYQITVTSPKAAAADTEAKAVANRFFASFKLIDTSG